MNYSEPTEKDFDCVAMKKAAQAEIYEKTKHLSGQALIDWYESAAENGSLGDAWRRIKAETAARAAAQARPTD